MPCLLYNFVSLVGSVLIAGAVLASPWIFRSSFQGADTAVYAMILGGAAAAFLSILIMPRRLRPSRSAARLFPASLLVLAGIGLGFLQVHPFSESVIQSLSPEIARKAELLLPLPGTEEAELESALLPEKDGKGYWPSTISVCTQQTRDQIADLILAFMGFVSGGILFQTRKQRLRLWRLAALNGLLLALMVIVLKGVGEFPGYRRFWPDTLCGTFVNRNSLAGYLCICLGPAMGLLLRGVLAGIRSRGDEELCYEGMRYERRSFAVKFLNGISDFFSLFSGKVLPWLAAAVLLMAGAVLTFSRGGTLAALFTFMTAAVFFSVRRRSGLFLVPVWGGLAALFFLIFWLGMNEPVLQRMETLLDTQEHESAFTANSRLDNWKSAFETAKLYQWRGTGLGTYALANRANDEALISEHYFCFAENQAVETMLTAGWPGLVLLFGEILLFWYFVMKGVNAGRKEMKRIGQDDDTDSDPRQLQENADAAFIFSVGTAALLTGQMVSGSFDFGLFFYPNALLAALLCGSFAGGILTASGDAEYLSPLQYEQNKKGSSFTQTLSALCLTAAAAGLGVYGFLSVYHRKETERLCAECLVPVAVEDRGPAYFSGTIEQLNKALKSRPDDPTLHYQLAEIYIAQFRQLFLEERKAENPELDPEVLWNQTAPESVFANMRPFFQSGMNVVPRRFRNDPIVAETLVPALRELWIARRLAPLFPEPHIESAILAPLALEVSKPLALVETALNRVSMTSPNEPGVLFSSGLLYYLSGNREKAVQEWQKSVSYSVQRLPDVTRILAGERVHADFRQMLGYVISGDWKMAELGVQLFPKKEEPMIHAVYLELMQQILNAAEDKESPDWIWNSAKFKDLTGEPAEAELLFQKGLEADPFSAQRHYEYGSFLLRNGKKGEASDEFSRALELDPKSKAYRKVMAELNERR